MRWNVEVVIEHRSGKVDSYEFSDIYPSDSYLLFSGIADAYQQCNVMMYVEGSSKPVWAQLHKA